ncbi:diguanylate cyclase [Thiogranum longum]|uniref:diguanylate cyclase n=1 Tax=Thiogranum longum TaxID=1537524 RepID=A0A4R1HBZ1_9GAMM|nr:GGDEF domain-containing protein [Thiogranum longum]TCK18053.1 diguanylate cyclase [Thiogranum longum]
MQYQQDVAQAQEIARLVFPLMTRLGIPMNPVNYALWYEYQLGRMEELVTALDKIQCGDEPYDPERAKALFLRYVATPGVEALERIESEVCRLLADVVQIVIDTGLDLGKYSNLLQSCSTRLESADDLRSIRKLVATLKSDTGRVAESSQQTAGTLKAHADEIDLLRAELDRVRQEAVKDPLTGLANRRAFDERLAESLDDSLQQLSKICLLMVDIDHFKKINDEHGHQIGDKILQYVSSVLKKNFKGKDLVARFGGDEFAVIVENAPIAGVQRVAETIREQVSDSTLKRTDTGEPLGKVTVSIGYDCLKPDDRPGDVLKRADKALYTAKQNGRNRVELFRR